MQAQAQDAKIFSLMKPQYQYYTYEYERYWAMLQVFGRIGYNPDTSNDVWDEEFNHRFGKQAGPIVEKGLHEASQILPHIVAAVYPYNAFPMTRGWAEELILGVLARYATAEGSDTAQFDRFDEEAQVLLGTMETAKRPEKTSKWFHRHRLERPPLSRRRHKKAIGTSDNKEFNSTMVDLEMLADLADFHSCRVFRCRRGLPLSLSPHQGSRRIAGSDRPRKRSPRILEGPL